MTSADCGRPCLAWAASRCFWPWPRWACRDWPTSWASSWCSRGRTRSVLSLAAIAAVGFVLSSIYSLWLIYQVFQGPAATDRARRRTWADGKWSIFGCLIAGILWLGLYPQPVLNTAKPTVDSLVSSAADVMRGEGVPPLRPAGMLPAVEDKGKMPSPRKTRRWRQSMTGADVLHLLPLIVLAGGTVVGMLGIAVYRSHVLTFVITLGTLILSFVALRFPLRCAGRVHHAADPIRRLCRLLHGAAAFRRRLRSR